MFKVIQVEGTPNPDALKFNLNSRILEHGVRQFDTPAAGKGDPVATGLFEIDGVESVFYMGEFVTVSKKSEVKWSDLEPKIKTVLENNNLSIQAADHAPTAAKKKSDKSDPELDKINEVIDQYVRPSLAGDGGGLDVMGYDNHVLTIHYQGACGSCPSATAGTMSAVENLLQRMIDPRIKVVSG